MSCIYLDSGPGCRNLFKVLFCGLTRSKSLAGEMGIFQGRQLPLTLPTCNASHSLALGISVKSKSAHGRGHSPFRFLDTSPRYFFAPCHQRAKLHGVVRESISQCVACMYAIRGVTELQTTKAMHLYTDYHSLPVCTSCAPAILFLFLDLSKLNSCPHVCIEKCIHLCSVHLCILDQIHSDPNTQIYTSFCRDRSMIHNPRKQSLNI